MAASNQSSMNFFNNHLNSEFWNHLSSMHPAMAPAAVPVGHSNSHPFAGLQMPHFFPYGAAHMPPAYSANLLANLASYPNLANSLPAGAWKSPAPGGFLPRYWLPNSPVVSGFNHQFDAPHNISAQDRSTLLPQNQNRNTSAADLANSEDKPRSSPVQTASIKETNILDLRIKIDP